MNDYKLAPDIGRYELLRRLKQRAWEKYVDRVVRKAVNKQDEKGGAVK